MKDLEKLRRIDLVKYSKNLRIQVNDMKSLFNDAGLTVNEDDVLTYNSLWYKTELKSRLLREGRIIFSTEIGDSDFLKEIILELQTKGMFTQDRKIFITNDLIVNGVREAEKYLDGISFIEISRQWGIPVKYVRDLLDIAIKDKIIQGKINRREKRYYNNQIASIQSTKKEMKTFEEISTPFFCQVCEAKRPSTKKRLQCHKCSRFVCEDCFRAMREVGKTNCPMCGKGNLVTSTK